MQFNLLSFTNLLAVSATANRTSAQLVTPPQLDTKEQQSIKTYYSTLDNNLPAMGEDIEFCVLDTTTDEAGDVTIGASAEYDAFIAENANVMTYTQTGYVLNYSIDLTTFEPTEVDNKILSVRFNKPSSDLSTAGNVANILFKSDQLISTSAGSLDEVVDNVLSNTISFRLVPQVVENAPTFGVINFSVDYSNYGVLTKASKGAHNYIYTGVNCPSPDIKKTVMYVPAGASTPVEATITYKKIASLDSVNAFIKKQCEQGLQSLIASFKSRTPNSEIISQLKEIDELIKNKKVRAEITKMPCEPQEECENNTIDFTVAIANTTGCYYNMMTTMGYYGHGNYKSYCTDYLREFPGVFCAEYGTSYTYTYLLYMLIFEFSSRGYDCPASAVLRKMNSSILYGCYSKEELIKRILAANCANSRGILGIEAVEVAETKETTEEDSEEDSSKNKSKAKDSKGMSKTVKVLLFGGAAVVVAGCAVGVVVYLV